MTPSPLSPVSAIGSLASIKPVQDASPSAMTKITRSERNPEIHPKMADLVVMKNHDTGDMWVELDDKLKGLVEIAKQAETFEFKSADLADTIRPPVEEREAALGRHGRSMHNFHPGDVVVSQEGVVTFSGPKMLSARTVPLAMTGLLEGRDLGKALLKHYGRERIVNARHVVSPYLRAKQTFLVAVVAGMKLAPEELRVYVDADIRERAGGDVEGMNWEEAVKVHPGITQVMRDPAARFPNGESARDTGERWAKAVDWHTRGEALTFLWGHKLGAAACSIKLVVGDVTEDAFKVRMETGTMLRVVHDGAPSDKWKKKDWVGERIASPEASFAKTHNPRDSTSTIASIMSTLELGEGERS